MTDKIEECSCDSVEAKPVEQPKEAQKVEAQTEQVPSWAKSILDNQAKLQTDYSSISGTLEKLKSLEVQSGTRQETPKPTATVSKDDSGPTMSLQRAFEKVSDWMKGSRENDCAIVLDTKELNSFVVGQVKGPGGVQETFLNPNHTERKIREALTFTGTHTNAGIDTDVLLEPSSKSQVPVTQFARVKDLPQGETFARFLKAGIPTEVTQTVGTTATEGTIDLESVAITPSTITGNAFKVDSDDIEDQPIDLLGLVVRNSAMNYNDFISTDMLDTVSAQGTLSAGLWVNAETGATITHSDNAGITLEPLGIATARAYLESTGYLNGGVKPVLCIDPEQWTNLVTSSNLTTYVQQGDANITKTGMIEEILGCRIVVTNTIEHKTNTTTNAHNALMFVPNHSYGIATKRRLTLKFHDIPQDNQIWVVNNWRAKAGVLDATSIVRLSSSDT